MKNIKRVVKNLVKRYGTHNPEVIIRELKISIIDYPFPPNINGLYICLPKKKIIMVSNSIYDNFRKIVLAHELAHYILHKGCNHIFFKSNTLFNIDKFETEADHFTFELLFSDGNFDENNISENVLNHFYNIRY